MAPPNSSGKEYDLFKILKAVKLMWEQELKKLCANSVSQ